jgi:hypothetical protein
MSDAVIMLADTIPKRMYRDSADRAGIVGISLLATNSDCYRYANPHETSEKSPKVLRPTLLSRTTILPDLSLLHHLEKREHNYPLNFDLLRIPAMVEEPECVVS